MGKFALVGKTKVKLTNITPLALKKGQKDLTPAVAIRVKYRAPSTVLDMFDGSLRGFLFKKPSAPAKQQAIEGVSPVSELTEAALALGAFNWGYEQTGCTFVIYRGVTGDKDVQLKDCTVKKVKITPHEGDAVDIEATVHAADLDEETMGAIAVLKQHEVEVELTLPEPLQKSIDAGEDDKPKGQVMTPLSAMQKGKPASAPATAH